MKSAHEVVDNYRKLYKKFEELRHSVEKWLAELLKQSGIKEARIESRTKDPRSFFLKIRRKETQGRPWKDPLAEASDKVGLRVDVVFEHDVEKLKDAILGASDFCEGEIEVDDKLANSLGTSALGYNGVHFDLVPKCRPTGLPPEYCKCEIQVRTTAQSAWAMATHDLTYKAPIEVSSTFVRRINRLTALLETFDDTVRQAVEAMVNNDRYPFAKLVDLLEERRFLFTHEKSDSELTRHTLSAIFPELDANCVDEVIADVDYLLDQKEGKLEHIMADDSGGLYSQPEALVVFAMLERRRMTLRRRWLEAGLPFKTLEEYANRWGKRLPDPD